MAWQIKIKNLWLCVLILLCFDAARCQETETKDAAQKIKFNQKLKRSISGGEAQKYQIPIKVGQFLRVTVEQRGVDVVLSLFAPDGNLIVERDRPNGKNGEESLSAEVSEEGVYRLEIRALKKDAPPGKYELKCEAPRLTSKNDKLRIFAEESFQSAEKLSDGETVEELREAVVKYGDALTAWREIGDRYAVSLTQESLAFAQSDLGDKLKKQNTSDSMRSAAAAYQKASELFAQINNKQKQGEAMIDQGIVAEQADGRDAALRIYEQALAIFLSLKNERWESVALNNIGFVYSKSGEKQKALEYYNRSLILSRKIGDKTHEATVLANIAAVLKKLGEKQEALKNYALALAIYKEKADKRREAELTVNIGLVYDELNEKPKAIEYLNTALLLKNELGDKAGAARTLQDIGLIYDDLKDFENASAYFKKALSVYRELDDKKSEADILRRIATLYFDKNDYREALKFYHEALMIFQKLDEKTEESYVINSIGRSHTELGEYREALKFYEQALALKIQIKNKSEEALILRNIGYNYKTLGEVSQAIKFFNQSLTISKEINDNEGEADSLIALSNAISDLGETNKALTYLNKALEISRAKKDESNEAATLHSLGIIYDALGNRTEALRNLNLALNLRQKNNNKNGVAATLASLGAVFFKQGDYRKALDYLTQSLKYFQQTGDIEAEAIMLNHVGVIYFTSGEREKGLEYLNRTLPILKSLGVKKREAETSANLMRAYNILKNPQRAIFYGKQAVNIYQQFRLRLKDSDKDLQLMYLKSVEPTYRKLADILIAEGRILEAQAVLDLLKEEEYEQIALRRDGETPAIVPYSRIESEVIAKIENLAALQREQSELQKEQKNKGSLPAEKQKRLDTLLQEIETANKAFRSALELLAESETSVGARVSEIESERSLQRILGQLSRELNTGVVALYTVIGADEPFETGSSRTENVNDRKNSSDKTKLKFGWVIMVTPEGRKAYPIDVAELEETIFAFRVALNSEKYDPEPLARKIYDKIFRQTSEKQKQTLEADLEIYLGKYKDKTLMWSLDGILRYIPTAALHDGKQYLIEKYRQVVFTKKSFLTLAEKDTARWQALGLGVSKAKTIDEQKFGALPEVERELQTVVREANERTGILNGTRRINQDFTRDGAIRLWREGKYSVVHIASHYSFNPADQANSFLLVGDGKLTFADIQNKDNLFGAVDLLTLSACDTAMSGNGKESESFAYMAQDLGAKTVIASLWKVSDAGTPELMIRFYKLRATNPQMPKGEAFRQAQLSLLYGDAKTKPTAKANSTMRKNGVIDLVGKKFVVPLYEKTDEPPFAHPHYWASFILIGNWR